jgi:hypothetical protein
MSYGWNSGDTILIEAKGGSCLVNLLKNSLRSPSGTSQFLSTRQDPRLRGVSLDKYIRCSIIRPDNLYRPVLRDSISYVLINLHLSSLRRKSKDQPIKGYHFGNGFVLILQKRFSILS